MNKHPVVMACILFFGGGVVSTLIQNLLQAVGFSSDLGNALGRIIAGLIILFVYRKCFRWGRSLRGFLYVLPVMAYVEWNVVGSIRSGDPMQPVSEFPVVFLMSIAPALFEETVFRGYLITKLMENGKSEWFTLLASSAVFGAVHLVNLAGFSLPTVALQVVYAAVVGLFFGAVYIRTRDFLSLLIGHAAVDFSSLMFAGAKETVFPIPLSFYVLLAATVALAIWIMSRRTKPFLEL